MRILVRQLTTFVALFILWTGSALAASSCYNIFLDPLRNVPEGMLGISGYANVFGVRDSVGDISVPGSFSNAERSFRPPLEGGQASVKMYWAHDSSKVVGAWTYVREDSLGLYIEGYVDPGLPSTHNMLNAWVDKPFVGLSIGGHFKRRDGRVIYDVDLREVSLTDYPVNQVSYFTIHSSAWPTTNHDVPSSPDLIPRPVNIPPTFWDRLFFRR